MTRGRDYKAAMTIEESLAELHRCAGTQFSPQAVAVLARLDPALLKAPARRRPAGRRVTEPEPTPWSRSWRS
jgi:HD-GYP domain-containing protein (c-di-GMP phosphodiesterase class II)